MFKKLSSLLVGVLIVHGAALASEAVLFEQVAGENSTTGYISSPLDASFNPPGYASADNFTLAQDSRITDIHWWGATLAGGTSFTFSFLNDFFGTPGALAAPPVGGTLTATAETVAGWTAPFYQSYYYSSVLSTPFVASAGTKYWVSIFNEAADASWVWLMANAPGDGAAQGLVTNDILWHGTSTDLSLRLTGEPIPEPTSLALIGIGMAGLAASRRRRQ